MLLTSYTEAIRGMDTACEASEWWSQTSVRYRTSHGVRGVLFPRKRNRCRANYAPFKIPSPESGID